MRASQLVFFRFLWTRFELYVSSFSVYLCKIVVVAVAVNKIALCSDMNSQLLPHKTVPLLFQSNSQLSAAFGLRHGFFYSLQVKGATFDFAVYTSKIDIKLLLSALML